MAEDRDNRGKRALRFAALFAAYVVTARLGLALGAVSGFATLVWPPTGIALFALLRYGYRLWPAIFAGAFVANFMNAVSPSLNLGIAPSAGIGLAIAAGNTAEALVATFLLNRVGFDRNLGRLRDVGALLLFAACLSTTLSATVGVLSLWLGRIVPPEALASTWKAWWLGDALGAFTVAPFLLVWARPFSRPASPRRLAEAALMFVALTALALLVFGDVMPQAKFSPVGWPYFVFPGLIWASMRFSQRGAVTATAFLAVVTIGATILGHGPFARSNLSESLIFVQVFMAVSTVTSLVLGAAIAERDRARAAAEAGLLTSKFLAEATATLAASLDLETTLKAVARLVVPILGDNCVVDLVDAEGNVRRVAEAAADPQREPLLRRLRSFPPGPNRTSPVSEVLKTGKTVFIPNFNAAALEKITAGDEYTAIVRQLAPRSAVTVPLVARGRILGAITFGMAESARHYGRADIELAEELGSRAGIAIDRALLLAQERETHERSALLTEKLSEALRVREDFLAIAGHELKTPLAALLLHIQNLQRTQQNDGAPTKLTERLVKAVGAAHRLENLINQMLDVSRITAGRLQLDVERFELKGLLSEVVERFADQAQRAGSSISLDAQATAVGAWDRLRIDQVLGNLLANAIKYGQGRPIHVQLREEAGEAVVSVTDGGIGIEPCQQNKIFERFERAVGTREFGGFGLGLWITRQIVEASGGSIGVQSAPGQGSIFTVRLPLSVEAPMRSSQG
jgi:signal transduction histidine kinase/integral membrane sensor domain MASE1